MTRDDIIAMAREAWGDDSGKPWSESALLHLELFAELVAAAEREACAKVCDEQAESPALAPLEKYRASFIADAIRARGEKT